MTLEILILNKLITDITNIIIRDDNFKVLAEGAYYEDNIIKYYDYEIESFTWQDDYEIFINIKQGIDEQKGESL